jgi:VCBS repeat-containing protein
MAPTTRPQSPVQTVAQNDFLSATEDALTNLSVLTNDRSRLNAVYSLDQFAATTPSQSLSATSVLGASLSINSDGTISYNSTSSTAIQALAAGQTTTDSFVYWVNQGNAYSKATVTVTVTGTNDAPNVTGVVAGTATEDGAAVTLNALANATDVDIGTTLSLVNVPAAADLPAGVTYNPTAKTFSLDPSDAAYQGLASDDQTTVTVNYGVSDGMITTDASASWVITGTHDYIVRGDPSSNFENLFGHTGESDIFIFDGANVSTSYRYDFLYGFESGLDKIAMVNVSPETIVTGPHTSTVNATGSFGANDPTILDGHTFLQFNDETTIRQLIAVAVDAPIDPSDVLVYGNDPFLIEPNLIYDEPGVAYEYLHGTAGEVDHFIFDTTYNPTLMPEIIIGFEAGSDKIVMLGHEQSDYAVLATGAPGDLTDYTPDGVYHFAIPENDPNISEGLVGAELAGHGISLGTIYTIDAPDITMNDVIVSEQNLFLV